MAAQPALGSEGVAGDCKEWLRVQQRLVGEVEIPLESGGYRPRRGDLIFGLDVEYQGDRAYAALDVHRWEGELVGRFAGTTPVRAPYVPGFFAFREGPPLLALIRAVHSRFQLQPALLLTDGHGIAHPRRFGVACWLGVRSGVPTIGCAKETLIRYRGNLARARGSCLVIEDQGERVGAALRTQENVKPVFVSPGHKVSLEGANDVILRLSPRYRLPEPLRRAHQSAQASARGAPGKATTSLGELK